MSDGLLLLWGAWESDYTAPAPSAHDEALWFADPRPLTFEEWWAERSAAAPSRFPGTDRDRTR